MKTIKKSLSLFLAFLIMMSLFVIPAVSNAANEPSVTLSKSEAVTDRTGKISGITATVKYPATYQSWLAIYKKSDFENAMVFGNWSCGHYGWFYLQEGVKNAANLDNTWNETEVTVDISTGGSQFISATHDIFEPGDYYVVLFHNDGEREYASGGIYYDESIGGHSVIATAPLKISADAELVYFNKNKLNFSSFDHTKCGIWIGDKAGYAETYFYSDCSFDAAYFCGWCGTDHTPWNFDVMDWYGNVLRSTTFVPYQAVTICVPFDELPAGKYMFRIYFTGSSMPSDCYFVVPVDESEGFAYSDVRNCVIAGSPGYNILANSEAYEYVMPFAIHPTSSPSSERMFGDVDGDEDIDADDQSALASYLASYDYSSKTSSVSVSATADTDGDGIINGYDLLLLTLYLNNQEVTLGMKSKFGEVKTPAKVIIIAGQSNAVGATMYNAAPTTLSQAVGSTKYAEYEKGYENIHITYVSEAGGSNGVNCRRNCSLAEVKFAGFDTVFPKVKLGEGSWVDSMFGPEVGIAEKISAQYPGEDVFIIKVAKGGVAIPGHWLSGQYCYNALANLLPAVFDRLEKENYIPEVVSICWMQGENDAGSDSQTADYLNNLTTVASSIRSMCADYAPEGGIPFIDAGITGQWKNYKLINSAKQTFAASSPLNYYFATNDLATDVEHNNSAHYAPGCVITLGHRFGDAILSTLS